MRRVFRGAISAGACLALLAILGGCGPAAKLAANTLGGGGPKVAANVQAGKTNAQVLGPARFSEQKLERAEARTIEQSAGETGVRAEAVQSVTVRNEAAAWVWLLLIAGWVLPSPAEIGRALVALVKKGRRNADTETA